MMLRGTHIGKHMREEPGKYFPPMLHILDAVGRRNSGLWDLRLFCLFIVLRLNGCSERLQVQLFCFFLMFLCSVFQLVEVETQKCFVKQFSVGHRPFQENISLSLSIGKVRNIVNICKRGLLTDCSKYYFMEFYTFILFDFNAFLIFITFWFTFCHFCHFIVAFLKLFCFFRPFSSVFYIICCFLLSFGHIPSNLWCRH